MISALRCYWQQRNMKCTGADHATQFNDFLISTRSHKNSFRFLTPAAQLITETRKCSTLSERGKKSHDRRRHDLFSLCRCINRSGMNKKNSANLMAVPKVLVCAKLHKKKTQNCTKM